MIPSHDTEHVDEGLAYLIEQFKTRPVIEGILKSYLSLCQTVEDALWAIIEARDLDVATGINLDTLGDIVGEKRLGRNDTVYRAAIRLRIRVNRSQGRAEDIIDVARLASGGVFKYYEYFPKGFAVEIYNLPTPDVVGRMLYATKPAGTAAQLYTSNWPDVSQNFTWDNSASHISGNVWADAGGTIVEKWICALDLSSQARSWTG